MGVVLKSLGEFLDRPSPLDSMSNFLGDVPEGDWMCVASRTRDSDAVFRANFRSALGAAGGGGRLTAA